MAETSLTRTDREQELEAKLKQARRDLVEAGSPASLTVEVMGGGISGWGLTRAIYAGLNAVLKPKPGVEPGFFRKNKEFTKGVVAGVVGLAGGVLNLALPYKFPLSYPRGMALQGSVTMLTSGLDRIVDNFPAPAAPALPAKQ